MVVLNGVMNRSREHLVFAFDSAHVREVRTCRFAVYMEFKRARAVFFFFLVGLLRQAKVGVDGDPCGMYNHFIKKNRSGTEVAEPSCSHR